MIPKSINRNGEGMLYHPAWMRVNVARPTYHLLDKVLSDFLTGSSNVSS
jgi:hypothetical protein